MKLFSIVPAIVFGACLAALVLAFALVGQREARADGPLVVNGKWAGPAFAAPFDLDGDSISPARTFDMRAYGQLRFIALQGSLDACLAGAGSCAPANGLCPSGALELVATGRFLFRGLDGDAVYAQVDSSHHLCFDPASPDEAVFFTVVGATGIYAGRTGSGIAHVHDTVLIANGIVPLFIDSRGEFTLTLQ